MPDYQKTTWVNGGAPGISAEKLNKLETQYDTVKTEVQRTDGTSAIKPHGSNLVDNTVTDAKVGNRTVNDSAAPTGDTGTLTTLLGWLANMVKVITGKASWRTAPATTLEAAKGHMDASAPHTGHAPTSHTHLKSAITDFAHKSTHATGQGDALAPGDIGGRPPPALSPRSTLMGT